MIDPITEFIFQKDQRTKPLFNAKQLPEPVIKHLTQVIYPRKNYGHGKKKYGVGDINQANKSAYYMVYNNEDPGWSQKNLQIVKRLKLIGIYGYGNGDYAWYSLVNGKVYDMNHDLGNFSAFLSKQNLKYKNRLYPPMTYKQWATTILNSKRMDAWRK